MQFIQSLSLIQESSALILPDLKKVMLKDKRVVPFLKQASQFTDIDDPKVALETLKFYMLNNPNVTSHVKMRDGAGKHSVNAALFSELRQVRDLDEKKFIALKDLVQDIFKDHSSMSKGVISSQAMKELRSWADNSGRYYNLTAATQKELDITPALKPNKPIVVYRGLLFKEYDFREVTNAYDKSEPNGKRFSKAIRDNKKEVDLSWDRPSSWSKSKSVASRFAKYGPAQSMYGAMFQSLSRKGEIDGVVGYIVAMLVEPEDVLIDFSKANATIGQFEDEQEVIVKPGKYHCKIVKKFTPTGEVDPSADAAVDSQLAETMSKVKGILDSIASISIKDLMPLIDGSRGSYSSTKYVNLIKTGAFSEAVLNSTTTTVIHLHDKILNEARKMKALLKGVNRAAVSTDTTLNNIYVTANKVLDRLGRSLDFENAQDFRKQSKMLKLDFEQSVMVKDGFYSKQDADSFIMLGKALGVPTVSETKLHMVTKAKQSEYIQDVLTALLKSVGLDVPENKAELKTKALSLVLRATRNAITAKSYIADVVEAADGNTGINKDTLALYGFKI